MVKVSVIVPVYNAGENLRVCLETLVNQTIDNIEIIAIDDASTDDSLKLLKEFAEKYSCLKVYHNEKNLGQSMTRNIGLSLATGEYIGFLDADDYVSLDMYKTMYEASAKNNFPDVVTTSLRFVNDDSYAFKKYDFDLKGRNYKVTDNCDSVIYESPSCCNKLFKRDLIGNYRFIPGVMWEDVAFTYSRLIKAENILMMNNLDYFYRRDINKGVSGHNYKFNSHVFDIIRVASEIESEARKCGKYEKFKKQIKYLQMASSLQRISEIETWNMDIVSNVKNEMYRLILENFGDLSDADRDLLSSRVSLDVIKDFDNYCQSLGKVEIKNENSNSL